MSKQTILLCVFAALSWSVVSATVLAPPLGYSVGFTGVIRNGVQKYVCKGGSWTKTGSTADVYGVNNVLLAKYWSVYDVATRSTIYYWNVINSVGTGYEEGGQAISGLQASPLTTALVGYINEYLALVKVHRGSGDAAQVAFVSLTGTGGGLPPSKALCTSRGSTSGVPFTGKFTFYTQDLQPPKVPASITPQGLFIQTVFLEGKMMYKFQGGQWIYVGFFATMTDVAGGNTLGKCGTVKGGYMRFAFRGVTQSTITAYRSTSTSMSAVSCPWQLAKITSFTGTGPPFGKYTNALMGATYGGTPPKMASRTEGMQWGSCFTAQVWFFAQ